MNRRRRIEQRLHDPPLLLDSVLAGEPRAVTDDGRLQQYLVRGGPFTPLLRELHVQLDRRRSGDIRTVCVDDEPDAGRRVELDHELVRRLPASAHAEAQLRSVLEDETKLRLGAGQALAGADEERHTGPAPVLDLEP